MIKFITASKEGLVNNKKLTEEQRQAKKLANARYLAKLTPEKKALNKLKQQQYHAKLKLEQKLTRKFTPEQRAAYNVKRAITRVITRANVTPEQRAAQNLKQVLYRQSPEGQHVVTLYNKSSQGIASRNAARKRYNASAKGLAAKKRGRELKRCALRAAKFHLPDRPPFSA